MDRTGKPAGEKGWILLKEHKAMLAFGAAMALYYGWRMFALDPWYDELYTYYSFISKGPVYAAIHWPVPNNHVFYSVLSGCLTVFGNPCIALRGVSWLCASGNLFLVYRLGNRLFSRWMALNMAFLYAAFYQVNALSIQGRGYTLSISFYLLALLMLLSVCLEASAYPGPKWYFYLVFSLSLTAGLYTVPSNIYWVLPVCLAGGLFLLLKKEMQTLFKLILASVAAAVNTLGLYSVIWLAIGSNLLSKTEGSDYYGIYQVEIILRAPFRAWKRGMDYMLASPYVQSIDRAETVSGFPGWLEGLLDLFAASDGKILFILLALSLMLCPLLAARAYRGKQDRQLFGYLALSSMLWGLPLMLVVQSVQPYYRVFTFLGAPLAWLYAAYLEELKNILRSVLPALRVSGDRPPKLWITPASVLLSLLLLCRAGALLSSSRYNQPYADREGKIREIWEKAGIEEVESICFLDDYQKYVLQFYWGLRPLETKPEEAEYLLLPKELMAEGYTAAVWPILYTHEGIDWDYLSSCEVVEETEAYLLYSK